MYYPEHKIVFIHIPKTAGKAIETALGFIPSNPFIHNDYQEHLKIFGGISKYFSFSFVRNPFDRLVSLYCYFTQISPGKEQYKHLTFKEYLFMHAQRKNQVDWISHDGRFVVDHIGKYEQLPSAWKYVQRKVFEMTGNVLEDLTIFNVSKHEHFSTYYDQEAIDHVQRIYAQDFIKLEYSPNIEDYGSNRNRVT